MSLSKIEQKLVDAIAVADRIIATTHDPAERIKATSTRTTCIVALELKDPAHQQIEENYKLYASLVQDAEKIKQEILAMIAEYKQKNGFFLPLGFDYNGGYETLDIDEAENILQFWGETAIRIERKSKVVDKDATIELLQYHKREIPMKQTKASIFEKKQHDEVEI